MPPRIRTRASKPLKENIDVTENKLKPIKSNTKAPRKALADKTNSASDDASLEIQTEPKKAVVKTSKTCSNNNEKKEIEEIEQYQTSKLKQNGHEPKVIENRINNARPRRDRRLPNRYIENPTLNNLSSSKDTSNVTQNTTETNPKSKNSPAKKKNATKDSSKSEPSPFKTPAKAADSSLLTNRPRRICRLPSRFEDHSISPSKYIPIQPANASTPIQSKTKPVSIDKDVGKDLEKTQDKVLRPTRLAKINALQKDSSDNSTDKSSPDINNAKSRNKKKVGKVQPTKKKQSPEKKNLSPIRKFLTPINKTQATIKKAPLSLNKTPLNKHTHSPIRSPSPKKIINNKKGDKNLSFKLLGSKKTSQETINNVDDVYEFTFDPDEEPQPQKKKRKRTVTKKPAASKPKKVVYKSTYDINISKALAALKKAVCATGAVPKLTQITEKSAENVDQSNVNTTQNDNVNNHNNMAFNDTGKASVHECNYPSIRVEDIAADIEPTIEHSHHDDINYSPVNSPMPLTTANPENHRETPERSVHDKDPLNLIEELSFFDEQPVASSSMNMSVRHPTASPWRVEFGSLPIKWHVNTYVKPNMTPAVESSFINPEVSIKKKHVYTNMVPETNDSLFQDVVDTTTNLKQTSIISFIKEKAEASAKKKRGRSVSPAKALLGIIDDSDANKNKKSKVSGTSNTSEDVSSSRNDSTNTTNRENSKEERKTKKRKNDENICNVSAKSPRKQKDKDCTYFGFDESENQDENVSPIKVNNNPKVRSLRPRQRAVLQEINGPTRAALPVAAKTKIATSSEAVNRVYEELKSATDAPVFPEKNVDGNTTNVEDSSINENSESVHLFEDIELIHHLKPLCKSYSKPKKVTFRQPSSSDSDTQAAVVEDQNESTDYDDLGDLTFEIPDVQEKKTAKKKKPRNLRSKKEEQEAEAWAANFNSMCEDIEDFPLLVE